MWNSGWLSGARDCGYTLYINCHLIATKIEVNSNMYNFSAELQHKTIFESCQSPFF